MITTPTVFILGAGASMPYGFPSGVQLANDICQASRDVLTRFGVGEEEYDKFATQLRASDQSSVDAFLEHQPDFLNVGKMAIAVHLIRRENPDNLRPAPKDWYTWVLDRMTAATPFSELSKNRVSFITFNYDRSLEEYLFTACCSRYGKSAIDVAKVLNGFAFIHLHGRLGYLPWQEGGEARSYARDFTPAAVRVAADGIKIISENIDDSTDFQQAQELMKNAERICILGFGYHPVNMKRLKIPSGGRHKPMGTCYGMTGAERQHLENTYVNLSLWDISSKVHDFLRGVPELQSD